MQGQFASKRGKIFHKIVRDVLQHLPGVGAHRRPNVSMAIAVRETRRACLLRLRLELELGVDIFGPYTQTVLG